LRGGPAEGPGKGALKTSSVAGRVNSARGGETTAALRERSSTCGSKPGPRETGLKRGEFGEGEDVCSRHIKKVKKKKKRGTGEKLKKDRDTSGPGKS